MFLSSMTADNVPTTRCCLSQATNRSRDPLSFVNAATTQIVHGNSTWTAPGHNAVLVAPNGTANIYHALNASHANATLRVAQLALDGDGWPVSGGP